MNTTNILAAAVAAATIAGSASAVTIDLDDFTTPVSGGATTVNSSGQNELSSNIGFIVSGANTVNPNGFQRTVALQIDSNTSAAQANVARVSANTGQLDMSAQADVAYTVFVEYAIGDGAASALASADSTGTIDFEILFADGNPRTVALSVNGVTQDSFTSADFVNPDEGFPELTRRLSFDTSVLNGVDDSFLISFDASTALDYTVNFFALDIPENIEPPVDVPAPAALGLLGFGLAGLGIARRRKA